MLSIKANLFNQRKRRKNAPFFGWGGEWGRIWQGNIPERETVPRGCMGRGSELVMEEVGSEFFLGVCGGRWVGGAGDWGPVACTGEKEGKCRRRNLVNSIVQRLRNCKR